MDPYIEWCRRAQPVLKKFTDLFSVAAVRHDGDVIVEFGDGDVRITPNAEMLDVATELLPLARQLAETFPYAHGEYVATRDGGFRQRLYVDEPKPRATKKRRAK